MSNNGQITFDKRLTSRAPSGGNGGRKGFREINPFDDYGGDAGQKGRNGGNNTSFGFGGGAGGGGGGGGWGSSLTEIRLYPGGSGGTGGNQFRHFAYGKFVWENPLLGHIAEDWFSVYESMRCRSGKILAVGGNGNGGRGGGLNRGSDDRTNGDWTKGADGPNAIGVWDLPAANISGKPIKANLFLENVSFFNKTFSDFENPGKLTLLSFRENILTNNVKFGADKESAKESPCQQFWAKPGLRNPNKFTASADGAPIYKATSSPRVPKVADTYDTTLKGSALADVFYVNVEDRSTIVGLTTNTTDPNNPFNKIWSKLVPDKSNDINDEYQSKANVLPGDNLQ